MPSVPYVHRTRGAWRPLAPALLLAAVVSGAPLAAQGQQAPLPDPSVVTSSATPDSPAELRYNNRLITTMRASILSRSSRERADGAIERIERLVGAGAPGPVGSRSVQDLILVTIGGQDVFAILPLDINTLGGETQAGAAAEAVTRLQKAMDEAVELRTPRRLLIGAATSLLATVIVGLLIWGTRRLRHGLFERISQSAERQLGRIASDDQLLRASRAPEFLRYLVRGTFVIVVLVLLYSWLTFVLQRFPYTRPWGESMRGFLLQRLGSLVSKFVATVPDLFTVLVIMLLTRAMVRLSRLVFNAAAEGRVALPWVYPETAQPTQRLVTMLLWLLGLVVAYPYLPGSESDAFKGVSVFVGLVISLGSSGIVNQMMSGLTLTYSRAVRRGDFVRIGDVEGTVTHLGALSTKVKNPRGEELTIPNAVVVSQVTTNYSRFADSEGVYIPTSVTIGYDTPWRQVRALLLLAAERTSRIRSTPPPAVRQTGLKDFYVEYTLLVCVEHPQLRVSLLDELHANIQDVFNEYGVQIMSPNYEADPEGRKVVPVDQFFAAPAVPPGSSARIR